DAALADARAALGAGVAREALRAGRRHRPHALALSAGVAAGHPLRAVGHESGITLPRAVGEGGVVGRRHAVAALLAVAVLLARLAGQAAERAVPVAGRAVLRAVGVPRLPLPEAGIAVRIRAAALGRGAHAVQAAVVVAVAVDERVEEVLGEAVEPDPLHRRAAAPLGRVDGGQLGAGGALDEARAAAVAGAGGRLGGAGHHVALGHGGDLGVHPVARAVDLAPRDRLAEADQGEGAADVVGGQRRLDQDRRLRGRARLGQPDQRQLGVVAAGLAEVAVDLDEVDVEGVPLAEGVAEADVDPGDRAAHGRLDVLIDAAGRGEHRALLDQRAGTPDGILLVAVLVRRQRDEHAAHAGEGVVGRAADDLGRALADAGAEDVLRLALRDGQGARGAEERRRGEGRRGEADHRRLLPLP